MWSDTLLHAERVHLTLLVFWGGLSAVAATALFAWTTVRHSVLLRQFAVQMGAWGLVIAAIGARELLTVADRDLGSATRLDRLLWFGAGLSAGLLLAGVALAIAGWRGGRRLGVVGAGIGVAVQNAALLALHLRFLAFTTRAL